MRPLPIRWKFALWSSGLFAAVLALYSVVTLLAVFRTELASVDGELAGEARHIADLDRGGKASESADDIMRHEPWLAYAHFDGEGRLGRHSSQLPLEAARAALVERGPQTVTWAATKWRLGAFRDGESTYVVAFDLKELQQMTSNLISSYAIAFPLVLLFAGAGGWWIAGTALAPVRRLTEAAESVQAARLDLRVPVPGARDEVQRLAIVFNAMLVRLEASFTQSQRFAADASHELRTPLTIMRGEIEQLLHADLDQAGREQCLLSLQEEIGRLDRVTDHLLLLARFDAGKVALNAERLDLSALVSEVCEDAELLAAGHGVTLRTEIAPNLHVEGNEAHLRRVFLNVLQNATRHNHPQGRVVCRLESSSTHAIARIANTGPAISPELRGRLFERFVRGDPSRTERGGHGLGLSLCREIVQAHGGTIVLAPARDEGWNEFVVELPLRR
jgi:heavy metal sensor kinase